MHTSLQKPGRKCVTQVVRPQVFDSGLASANGIIVIEAAGNGNASLDTWVDAGGLQRLDRADADFRDSGAIMVGSCASALPHNRYVGCGVGCGSNYGSRIDCFAWGENITTAGYGDLDAGTGDNTTYRHIWRNQWRITDYHRGCVNTARNVSGYTARRRPTFSFANARTPL